MALNDVISKLEKINNENFLSVYIPSLKKNVKFKPLTLKQQKDILKSSVTNDLTSVINFNLAFNKIIKENSVEKNNYKTIDRLPIIIALRNKFSDEPYEIDGKKIDLNQLTNQKLDIYGDSEFKIEEDILTVYASIPTLDVDERFGQRLLENIEKNNDNKLSNIVGDMYLYEISKFINKINVSDAEIELSTLNFTDTLELINKLPASIISKLNAFITKNIRDIEDNYTTVDGVKIPLDASLFV
jgi:hypothetical protein